MCSWPQGWHSRAESPMKQECSKELVRSKTAGFLAQKKLREPSLINIPLLVSQTTKQTCLLLPSLTWKSVSKRDMHGRLLEMKTHPEVQRARPQQGRCGRWSRRPGPCRCWEGRPDHREPALQEPAA